MTSRFAYATALTFTLSTPAFAGSLCNPQNFLVLAKLATANGIEWNGEAADCWLERSTDGERYIANRDLSKEQQLEAVVTTQPPRVQFKHGVSPVLCLDLSSAPKSLGSECPK